MTTDRNTPIRALVREAEGLSIYEAHLILTIDGHQGAKMWASGPTIAYWMKCSLKAFYTARKGLLDRGIINADERPGSTTMYTINREALEGLVPGRDPSSTRERPGLVPETDPSSTRERQSISIKENSKHQHEVPNSNADKLSLDADADAEPGVSEPEFRHLLECGYNAGGVCMCREKIAEMDAYEAAHPEPEYKPEPKVKSGPKKVAPMVRPATFSRLHQHPGVVMKLIEMLEDKAKIWDCPVNKNQAREELLWAVEEFGADAEYEFRMFLREERAYLSNAKNPVGTALRTFNTWSKRNAS